MRKFKDINKWSSYKWRIIFLIIGLGFYFSLQFATESLFGYFYIIITSPAFFLSNLFRPLIGIEYSEKLYHLFIILQFLIIGWILDKKLIRFIIIDIIKRGQK